MVTALARVVEALRGAGREQVRFIGVMTGGHVVIHWYQALYPVVVPTIKSALGLTDVEVGALTSARQLTSGFLNLPAGMIADARPRLRTALLASAILMQGVACVLMGLVPVFGGQIVAALLVGLASAIWHPVAHAGLSSKFPRRRGAVLSIHGIGATVADSATPLAFGALLAAFAWQPLLAAQLVPAILLAVVLWRMLAPSFGGEAGAAPGAPGLRARLRDVGSLLADRVFLGMSIANGLWLVGRLVVLTFLPIYLQEHLGYSTVVLGLYIGLLNVLGIASQGLLGLLSDRYGRKVVLVPSFLVLGALYVLLAHVPPGIALAATVAAIGLFFYTLGNITNAALFDVVRPGIAASAIGFSTVITQVFVLPAPILAGAMIGVYGIGSVFMLSGALMLLGGLVMVPLPLYRGARARR